MSFKIGDKVKLLTNFYEEQDYCSSVPEGSIVEVVSKCRTEGQWIDQTSVELSYLTHPFNHEKEFELATEQKEDLKVSKFCIGDRVISVKNTPAVPEGFIGKIVEISEFSYPISVTADDGQYGVFNEDELALLSTSKEASNDASKPDVINSPKHYAVFESVEAIQVIASSMTQEQFYGYCLGNCLKYRLRAGAKDDVMQELGKANKYQELYTQHKHLCKEGK